jgi:hypothetical protein
MTRVFDRTLWMNQDDNQGLHVLLPAVRDGLSRGDSTS